jgi:hypothetical protein
MRSVEFKVRTAHQRPWGHSIALLGHSDARSTTAFRRQRMLVLYVGAPVPNRMTLRQARTADPYPFPLAALVIACLPVIVSVLLFAPSAQAYSTNPHIAAFVEVFANGTPAEVRCPDSPEEWSFDLGDPPNAEEIYGRTFTQRAVVEFRSDLCPILDNLANSKADDSAKALAVLALVHESYHVRHWRWRLNEARVECQAIRHFRVGVRVLGGSQQLADQLFPFALAWHNQITQNHAYYLASCQLPQ